MNDKTRLAAMRRISHYEMRERPGAPSQWIKEHEGRLLMELVKLAHEAGKKFDGWPTITMHHETPNDYFRNELLLRAEVNCVPA